MAFDWHGASLSRETTLEADYRHTQNVRRFLCEQCGEHFRFDRALMAWIRSGAPKTLGDIADEWRRRTP